MKFTPASVALSKTRKDSASSVCLPNVPVPRQRRETVMLVEHWDVLQDEATRAESQSGRPMFGSEFPA